MLKRHLPACTGCTGVPKGNLHSVSSSPSVFRLTLYHFLHSHVEPRFTVFLMFLYQNVGFSPCITWNSALCALVNFLTFVHHFSILRILLTPFSVLFVSYTCTYYFFFYCSLLEFRGSRGIHVSKMVFWFFGVFFSFLLFWLW